MCKEQLNDVNADFHAFKREHSGLPAALRESRASLRSREADIERLTESLQVHTLALLKFAPLGSIIFGQNTEEHSVISRCSCHNVLMQAAQSTKGHGIRSTVVTLSSATLKLLEVMMV
jgi:hypothetical protein